MALRRNSLHKLLVHELEERVFVSVGNPKGASGNSDDPDGEEDEHGSVSNSLIRSTAPSSTPSFVFVALDHPGRPSFHNVKQGFVCGHCTSASTQSVVATGHLVKHRARSVRI